MITQSGGLLTTTVGMKGRAKMRWKRLSFYYLYLIWIHIFRINKRSEVFYDGIEE